LDAEKGFESMTPDGAGAYAVNVAVHMEIFRIAMTDLSNPGTGPTLVCLRERIYRAAAASGCPRREAGGLVPMPGSQGFLP
jgi:hypothetical protein